MDATPLLSSYSPIFPTEEKIEETDLVIDRRTKLSCKDFPPIVLGGSLLARVVKKGISTKGKEEAIFQKALTFLQKIDPLRRSTEKLDYSEANKRYLVIVANQNGALVQLVNKIFWHTPLSFQVAVLNASTLQEKAAAIRCWMHNHPDEFQEKECSITGPLVQDIPEEVFFLGNKTRAAALRKFLKYNYTYPFFSFLEKEKNHPTLTELMQLALIGSCHRQELTFCEQLLAHRESRRLEPIDYGIFLMECAKRGLVDFMQLLLKKNTLSKIPQEERDNALFKAATKGFTEAVRFLLTHLKISRSTLESVRREPLYEEIQILINDAL